MRQEIAKQTKMREVIQKKLHQMEDQKADVDVQRETLKAQIAGLEKGTGAMFYQRHTHVLGDWHKPGINSVLYFIITGGCRQ